MPSYEEEADVFGVKVYVFERPTTIAIEGTINFEDPTMYDADSVKVELYLSSEVDKADAQPIKRSKFEPSAYFFFGSLPPNDYSLVIRQKQPINFRHVTSVADGFQQIVVPKKEPEPTPLKISVLLVPIFAFGAFMWVARRKQ